MGSQRVGHNWATSISLFTFHFHALEKEMAAHSSVLAWRIPGTQEPGGLPSVGSHRVEHDWSDSVAAAAAAVLAFLYSKVVSVFSLFIVRRAWACVWWVNPRLLFFTFRLGMVSSGLMFCIYLVIYKNNYNTYVTTKLDKISLKNQLISIKIQIIVIFCCI